MVLDIFYAEFPPDNACVSLLPSLDVTINLIFWVFGKSFLLMLSNITFLVNINKVMTLKDRPEYFVEGLSDIMGNMILGEESKLMPSERSIDVSSGRFCGSEEISIIRNINEAESQDAFESERSRPRKESLE